MILVEHGRIIYWYIRGSFKQFCPWCNKKGHENNLHSFIPFLQSTHLLHVCTYSDKKSTPEILFYIPL